MQVNDQNSGQSLQQDISSLGVMRFILQLLLARPLALGALIFFGIVAACSELLSIALIMPFIESLRGGDTASLSGKFPIIGFLTPYFSGLELVNKIRLIAVALLVVELVKGFSRFISNVYSAKLQHLTNSDVQMRVLDQLLEAGRSFLHKEKMSNIYTILNNFTYNTGTAVLALTSIVPDLFMAGVSLMILFSISIPLTFITLGLAVGISLSLGHLSRLSQLYGKKNLQHQLLINQIGIEILNGMDVIRLFGRRRDVREKYGDEVRKLTDTRIYQGFLGAIISPLTTVLLVLTVTVILIASTFFLHREAGFWISMLMIFLVVFSRLGGPLARINLSRTQLVTLFPAIQALKDFLLNPNKEDLPEGGLEFGELKNEIRFDRVSFRYGPNEKDVLSGVSFSIPQGKTTAVVGGSGSGKTTIVCLLGRLYNVTDGRILVDGTDMREFKSASWHSRIGVVSQNIFLFNDTIGNNIRFGKPAAGDEEIERAAEKANAVEFILDTREGYDTLVGDRGIRLSGGQAQRISIARAILVRPQLLILDEATSALDSRSEKLVQEAIDKISHECTLLVVAHRLSTVQRADNIVVLHEGRVVEQGTHRELIARKSYYWKYVQLQNLGQEAQGESHDLDFTATGSQHEQIPPLLED